MLRFNKRVSYDNLIVYMRNRSLDEDDLWQYGDLIRLSAIALHGNEDDFMKEIEASGKSFTMWGILVLGEGRVIKSMPFLLRYLTHIETEIAENAYISLRKISNIDPARTYNVQINSPIVIKGFKKFYLENHKD